MQSPSTKDADALKMMNKTDREKQIYLIETRKQAARDRVQKEEQQR